MSEKSILYEQVGSPFALKTTVMSTYHCQKHKPMIYPSHQLQIKKSHNFKVSSDWSRYDANQTSGLGLDRLVIHIEADRF